MSLANGKALEVAAIERHAKAEWMLTASHNHLSDLVDEMRAVADLIDRLNEEELAEHRFHSYPWLNAEVISRLAKEVVAAQDEMAMATEAASALGLPVCADLEVLAETDSGELATAVD